MTEPTQLITCIGCAALVPDTDGAVHKYLGASAGCWEIYGEVLAKEYSNFRYTKVHNLTVDAYCLQHTGKPEKRTIQSAALHAISLYLQLEHNFNSMEAAQVKQKAVQHKEKYRWLDPPSPLGAITILDVHQAQDATSHIDIVERWAKSVWEAWQNHHQTIIEWTQLSVSI